MIKIKICGLKRLEDVYIVNKYRPDYAGFVFAGAKRKISFSKAAELKSALDDSIKSVGVFVNEDIDNIAALAESGVIDIIQLHGNEDKDFIREVKERTNKPVIRAVRVRSEQTIRDSMECGADFLLLDTYMPAQYGGSGETFDLSLIPENIPAYFLAGGLTADNVKDSVRACAGEPYAVDVSSGVETDGFKDGLKIKRFIEAVRSIKLR